MTMMVMPIKHQWNIDSDNLHPTVYLRLISEMEGCCAILSALPPDGTDSEDYKYIREACNRYYKVYFKYKKHYEATERESKGT